MTALDVQTMTALADSAIAKIDGHGLRGTSMVTYEEIEALACMVIALRAQLHLTHAQHGERT